MKAAAGFFLLCVCAGIGCAGAPVLPALEKIEQIKSDGTLDELSPQKKERVVAVLEQSAKSEAAALTAAKSESKWTTVGKIAVAFLAGIALCLILFFLSRLRRLLPF